MSKNHFKMYHKVKVDVWHYVPDRTGGIPAPEWILQIATPDGFFVNGQELKIGDYVVKENDMFTILDSKTLYKQYTF